MGSICLSAASILRCASISNTENIILVIPTALEVLFSTYLVYAKWGTGAWRHLLLIAEGLVLLVLTLLGLFSEVLPPFRDNLSLFRGFDLGIGIASFIPILLYTSFLFILTNSDLADILPNHLRSLSKLATLLFVPAIIIFNEIASFIGVTIKKIPIGKNGIETVTAIGFTSQHEEQLWIFFTSLTLALLTLYQAMVFCFAFFRVIQALLHQRHIERNGSDEAHMVNGIGWISFAAKIGALETVVGFAGGGFGIAIARRSMRLLARASLYIGEIKGVDMVEDFSTIQREIVRATQMRNKNKDDNDLRRSRIIQFISNPRLSTFRQLSPTATAFHSTPRAPPLYIGDSDEKPRKEHYSTHIQRQSQMEAGLPGMDQFAGIKERKAKQRVTVQYKGGTPLLHLRFSTLDVPSPSFIVDNVKSRPLSALHGRVDKRRAIESGYDIDVNEKRELDFQPPAPLFRQLDEPSDYRDSQSSVPSQYEIVSSPRRTLSQRSARAQLYSSPMVSHNLAPETMAVMAFPLPIYHSPPKKETRRNQVKSLADSLQAVHDLAGQFPGPPGAPMDQNRSKWEEDSRSSVLYPPGVMAPQVLGSPSDLVFKGKELHSLSPGVSTRELKDNATLKDSRYGSSIVFAEPSPIPNKAGRVPVNPEAKAGGVYRTSVNPRIKVDAPSTKKDIDPFDDEDEDAKSVEQTPTLPYIPPGKGTLLSSLKLNTSASLLKKSRAMPTNSDEVTPATGLSGFSQIARGSTLNAEDALLYLGSALDTGKSRVFHPPPLPHTISSVRSPQDEKLNRIANWVDTSATLEAGRKLRDPDILSTNRDTLSTVRETDDNVSVQVHDYHGKRDSSKFRSMDDLDIPWLKDSAAMEEDERRITQVMQAKSTTRALKKRPPPLLKIKTVGINKSASKPTPAPTEGDHKRGSTHLEPIVIPSRHPIAQAVQIEYGSVESHRGGVLRDSNVFGLDSRLNGRF